MTVAVVIFAVTYLAIALQRLPGIPVDRPAAALVGAVAMVAAGVLTIQDAYRAVNLDTLSLLLGVMIVAAYLTEAHFFRFIAWWVVTRARSARSLLWGLVFVSGGLSALLVNDTVCLMFTPLVLAVVDEAGLPALPYLLALASATNVGGSVTYTGNPQNMIIGGTAGAPGYLEFLGLALPAGALALTANAAALSWLFRKELPHGPLGRRATPRPTVERPLVRKGLFALTLFVVLAASGRSLAGAALLAAAVLILAARRPPRSALARVDWILLLFFGGLFVVVSGLEHSGALERMLAPVSPVIASGGGLGLGLFALFTVVGSNLVSNVPFVLVALHWVRAMPDPRWGFIVLAFASTLAGNLTVFGSMANLIVLESAGERGRIGFLRFLRYGSVLTLVTFTAAMAVLFLERALGL